MFNPIKAVANWWNRLTVNPGAVPLNNKFAHGPAPIPHYEHEDPHSKKSTWARLAGRQTMRESLMEEIIQTEQTRITKLRNIALLQADVDHATSIRDRLSVLYQQTTQAEHGLSRLKMVLVGGNDVGATLEEMRASDSIDPELRQFLQNTDPLNGNRDHTVQVPMPQTSTAS